MFVTLKQDWPLLIAGLLADSQTFIGWVRRLPEVVKSVGENGVINVCFCPQCIFTTCRKLNMDIVLLQPSIINDNIQAERL